MGAWGAREDAEHKPRFLTTDEKETTYASNRGWEYRNPNTDRSEVIVAISNLATKLGGAQVDSCYFVDRDAADDPVELVLNWNAEVNVNVGAYVTLSNVGEDASVTLTFSGYLGGDSNTNQTVFTYEPSGAEVTAVFSLDTDLAATIISIDSGEAGSTSLDAAGADNATDVRVTLSDTILA